MKGSNPVSTTRFLVAGVLALAAFGCGRKDATSTNPANAAAEAPPPPVETDLPLGARLIEPRADELVHQMSDRLAKVSAFALEAEEVFDEVPEQSPRQQLTNTRHVALRRPNRLAGDASGDALNRSFYYDGQTFSAIDKEQNVWASGTVPPTVDEMKEHLMELAGVSETVVGVLALVTSVPLVGQDLQQKLAAGKQAAAANQQALRGYAWLEKVELSFKGEVKSTKVSSCRDGPDGRVQKTPVVEPPPPEKQRGLKGKVIAKKTGEMKEELESAAALVQQSVAPSPDKIQVVMNAGTASLAQARPGAVALKFPG